LAVKRHHSEGLKMDRKMVVTAKAAREAGAGLAGSGCLTKSLRKVAVLP
jgi:hypothetical protein